MLFLGLLIALFPYLLEKSIVFYLRHAGYVSSQIEIQYVARNTLRFTDIHFETTRDDNVKIEIDTPAIDVRYSLLSLLEGRVKNITIPRFVVNVRLPDVKTAEAIEKDIVRYKANYLPFNHINIDKFALAIHYPHKPPTLVTGKIALKRYGNNKLQSNSHIEMVSPYIAELNLKEMTTFNKDSIHAVINPKSYLIFYQPRLGEALFKELKVDFLLSDLSISYKDPKNPIYATKMNFKINPTNFHNPVIPGSLGEVNCKFNSQWSPAKNRSSYKFKGLVSFISLPSLGMSMSGLKLNVEELKLLKNQWSLNGNYNIDKIDISGNNIELPTQIHGKFVSDPTGAKGIFQIQQKDHRIIGQGEWGQDFIQRQGKLLYQLQTQDFSSDPANLNQVFPLLWHSTVVTHGRLRSLGKITWKRLGDTLNINSQFNIQALDVDGEVGSLKFSGLNTDMKFTQFYPLKSLPNQKIKIKKIEKGINVNNVLATVHVEQEKGLQSRLRLDNISADFAGGRLGIDQITLDPDENIRRYTIVLNKLKLGELLKFFTVKNLTGTGVLSGDLPIVMTRDGINIDNGFIASTPEGGVIRYTPKDMPDIVKIEGQKEDLVKDALANIHYQDLKIHLNHTPDKTHLILRFRGFNPDVISGIPILINLNLVGRIDALYASGVVARDLERSLQGGIRSTRKNPLIINKTVKVKSVKTD